MSTKNPLPDLPKASISLPDTPLIRAALDHIQRHTSPTVVNHCIRSAYFAILLSRKITRNNSEPLDAELIVFSIIMHDLGWATDKTLLSPDKRFEVDGANMARSYLEAGELAAVWDKHRTQLMWDAIALHTSPSFAMHKEPEVMLAHAGITADFLGPSYPDFSITVEENIEIVSAFPPLGFKESFLDIMCGLCASKPGTTYDNFVGDYGVEYGLDGRGTGKDQYKKKRLEFTTSRLVYDAIGAWEQEEI